MAFTTIPTSLIDADSPITETLMAYLRDNDDYLKSLLVTGTGHTHDQGGTDQGGPVQPADGSVTPAKLAPSAGTYSQAVWQLNTERSYTAGDRNAWKLFKSQKVSTPGKYRVRFDGKKNSDDVCYGQIYVNGVAAGAQHAMTSSYVTYVDDIIVNPGDSIEVRMYISPGSSTDIVYCKDFRGFLMFLDSATITDANPA